MSENSGTSSAGQRGHINHIELCRRPLRRAVKGPPSGGGSSGQELRSKGRGQPPPDEKEWAFQPSKHFIPGKSFASSVSHLLRQNGDHPDPLAEGLSRPKTAVRLSNKHYESHLLGGAVAIVAPEDPTKPMRRPGTAPPRSERVLGADAADNGSAQPTYALLGSARREVFVTSRAGAAPACVLVTKMQTRSGYDKGRSAYGDVLQYRHSGGICPREYKMVAERQAAPQLVSPVAQQARSSFFESRDGYMLNRMRAQMSDVIIGH